VRFPYDLTYTGPAGNLTINGWTEYLIFVLVIRAVLGAEAAKKAVEALG
jgi:hypothetical protein